MKEYRLIYSESYRNLLFIAALSILFLLSACADSDSDRRSKSAGQPPSQDSPQPGGAYRVPLMYIPSVLDPAYIQDIYGVSIVRQLFDGLVQFGPYLTVLPALAESWQVENGGQMIRFFIREEARFHNGRLLTAEDARYSLIRLLRVDPPPAILPHLLKIEGARAYRARESEQVRGLQCIGERELQVRLTEPHAPFISALAMYQASIVPVEMIDGGQNRFEKNPVGTGPFKFVAWDQNRMIRLQRFDQHFAGKALLDEIQFRLYPGAQIDHVLSDFKRGELEEMPFYFRIRGELSDKKAYQRFHRPSLSLLYYGVNTRHPLLKHPEIRKALSLAIDRRALTSSVYNDQFDPAHSILPPGMPAYQRLEELTRFDLSAAKKITRKMTEEFSSGSWTLEIASASTSDFAKNELEMIRQSWLPLGVTLKTKFISNWAQFEQYIQSDSVQLYRYLWTADLPDPDSFLHPLFSKGSPENFGKFADDRTDLLLAEALTVVDPVERAKKYQEIERHILNLYPIIPLFYLSIDRVYQPYVQGVHISALGAHNTPLNRIWFKKVPGTTAVD